MPSTPLARLERARLEFGATAAASKLTLMRQLARTHLGSAGSVKRLHEALCFVRAYPDDAAVLAQAQAMLAGFSRRTDLRRHRAALADSGIAGTPIHYRFFAGQAQWLAQRWPDRLRLDRSDADAEPRIARALRPLLPPIEASALIELKLPGYAALDRLRGAGETDAVFLLRRIAAMPGNGFTREAYSDTIDASFVLVPGPDTPARTTAHFARAPVVFRREPPPRARPDLRAEMARAPRSVRRMSVRDGNAIVDLARGAMVTRARSLEAFSFADARDAWFVDDGDGLAFALVGVIPQRRHAVAAYLRRPDAAQRRADRLPAVRHRRPQRGAVVQHLRDLSRRRGGVHLRALARGAAACCSAPRRSASSPTSSARTTTRRSNRAPGGSTPSSVSRRATRATPQLARSEQARMRRNPGHRTLARHAAPAGRAAPVLRPRPRAPARPLCRWPNWACAQAPRCRRGPGPIGSAPSTKQAPNCMRRCDLASLRGFSPDQREAWRRFAPILALLDLGAWTNDERRALVDLVRAKGGRSERDYVARYLAHPKLDAALLQSTGLVSSLPIART